jgi:hypothetical protein
VAEAVQTAAARPRPRGLVAVAIGSVLLVLFLVVALRARLDIATFALVLAGLALVGCLRGLHRMVGVLARGSLDVVVDTEGEYGGISTRELREERRRLLRAINELRFDHEMGKLSKADYDTVRQGYELRVLEVMRALDAGESLHPELAARLANSEAAAPTPTPDAASAAAPTEPEDTTSRPCSSCDGRNDADAKFCKHCGKELAA